MCIGLVCELELSQLSSFHSLIIGYFVQLITCQGMKPYGIYLHSKCKVKLQICILPLVTLLIHEPVVSVQGEIEHYEVNVFAREGT
jgi:hypothetical protein